MKSAFEESKIIGAILDAAAKKKHTRNDIADIICKKLLGDVHDEDLNGKSNTLRVKIFVLLDELLHKGTLSVSEGEVYSLREGKATALRRQSCEEEILKLLTAGSKSKEQLKKELTVIFATNKTATKRDDNLLSELVSDTVKRLSRLNVIEYAGGKYRIPEKKSAMADNLMEIAALKADFLTLLHSRGGEFFEYYFMNLISRYLKSMGLRVTECTVQGGANDGGIDGIIRTSDSLGFRECIMVQTKNRNDHTSEVEVRSFWGAVCALGGSRGIYVTTSHFHPVAKNFIKGIDNCIGIDGDEVFALAKELEYGICQIGDKIMIDTDVI